MLDGLDHEHALQHAPVDQGHAEKRLISFFPGLLEIFEPRMSLDLANGNWPHQLRHQSREAFVNRHA